MTEDYFKENIMSIIIENRKKDKNIRSFVKYGNGRNLETWQWK